MAEDSDDQVRAWVSCEDEGCLTALIDHTNPQLWNGELAEEVGEAMALNNTQLINIGELAELGDTSDLDVAATGPAPLQGDLLTVGNWTAADDDDDDGSMNGGLLAGAVIGAAIVLGVFLAALLIWRIKTYRRRKRMLDHKLSTSDSGSLPSSPSVALTPMPSSQFLKSIACSSTLRRDPVLNWAAEGINHRQQSASFTSQGSTSTPTAASASANTYRMIDINEISINRMIGEGSYGRVFSATWQQTPVAFKVLVDPKDLIDEEAAKQENAKITAALEREASLMSTLRHPNCVQFLGAVAYPPGIITDWCSRGSLHGLLQQSKSDAAVLAQLTWQRRLILALDAAKGMLYLHSNKPSPVVHRDLKSANLLVTRDWSCKVADFNLSRLVEEHTRSNSSSGGSGPGNPRWLSPEIFSGEQFTTASDAYSFSMVLYELLVFQVPWVDANQWSVVAFVQNGQRPHIPAMNELPSSPGDVFTGLDDYISLMKRAWAQDPDERPRFEEIAAVLKTILLNTR